MSHGIDLLSKIISDRSISVFRAINILWLVGDEVNLYNFINDYLVRYRQLPSFSCLVENGYIIEDNRFEPSDYYLDRVRDRYVLGVARDNNRSYVEALQNRDVAAIKAVCTTIDSAFTTSSKEFDILNIQDVAQQIVPKSREALYRGSAGFTTGYAIVDEELNWLQQGDVHLLVGRPGTGKSYILSKMMYSAWLDGKSIMLVSLEMSELQMITRLMSIYAGINSKEFFKGTLSTYKAIEINRIISEEFPNLPPFYMLASHSAKNTVKTIERAIEYVDPDIVYIDASYMLTTEKAKYNKHEVVAEVFQDLKTLAKNTNKPFVATTQFNRSVATKRKKGESELSMEFISGSDVYSQISYWILGIHPPKDDPLSRSVRMIESLKGRDGYEVPKFLINYKFNPPNFDFLRTVTEDYGDGDSMEQEQHVRDQLANMNWSV